MNRKAGTGVVLLVTLLTVGLMAYANSLIISEVAWAGTAASSTDEWMELQNSGDDVVSLLGWKLVFGDTVIPLGEVAEDTVDVRTAAVNPSEFLILERTNDDSIADITADLIYKGTLSNSGMTIELRNPQGEVADTVVLTDEAGWPAGTASGGEPAYCTMERTTDGDWASNNGIVCNGSDAEGAPLNGTPGQMNSSEVLAQWAPAVDITFPSEPDSVLSGTEWITWMATDPDGTDSALAISIYLSQGSDQEWGLLVENLANMGSFSWDTTEQPSGDGYQLLVRAADSYGYVGEAVSSVFTINHAGD